MRGAEEESEPHGEIDVGKGKTSIFWSSGIWHWKAYLIATQSSYYLFFN